MKRVLSLLLAVIIALAPTCSLADNLDYSYIKNERELPKTVPKAKPEPRGLLINGLNVERKILQRNFTQKQNELKYIVIHDTGNRRAGADADANRNYFNSESAKSSAHWIVDKDSVIHAVENEYVAWHIGDGKSSARITNANSIGIELCVNSDGDWDKTRNNGIELVKYLMRTYGIKANNVVRHYDATGKTCPAMMIEDKPEQWDEFKKAIGGSASTSEQAINKEGTIVGIPDSDTVNIRSGPGVNSGIVAKLNKGNKVNVLAQHIGGWYKVKYTNKIGYIYGEYVKINSTPVEPEKPTESNAPQTSNNVSFREGPGVNYKVIRMLPSGTKIKPLSYKGDWLKVEENSTVGWLIRAYVKNINYSDLKDEDEGKPRAKESVNLRATPEWSGVILDCVPRGGLVSVLGKVNNEWIKIEFKGKQGYVSMEYILDVPKDLPIITIPKPTITQTNTSVNLREEPEWSANTIITLAKYSTVEVKSKTPNGWLHIKSNNKEGYVPEVYVDGVPINIPIISVKPKQPEIVSSVNLREYPDWSSKVIDIIGTGTTVKIIGKNGDWANISWNDSVGWVSKQYIKNVIWNEISFIEKPFTSNASTLVAVTLREQPNYSSNKIIVLAQNSRVNILGETNGWSEIQTSDSKGYIPSEYIIKDGNVRKGILSSSALIRKQPSWSAEKLEVLNKGTTLEVLGTQGCWVQVKYKGNIVYISSEYVDIK